MRLIDADRLKGKVLKWLPSDPCGIGEKEHPVETDIVVSLMMEIEEAPTVNEWIPVSDKLPETGDSILVTYSDEEVGIVWSARPKVWGKYEKANNLIFPIVWMPLPEPYKGDSEK